MHNEVGSARSAKMPDMIQKTTLQILLVSSETATSSESFSNMLDVGRNCVMAAFEKNLQWEPG